MLCCKGRNVPTCLYAIFYVNRQSCMRRLCLDTCFSFCGRYDLTLLHEIFIGRK